MTIILKGALLVSAEEHNIIQLIVKLTPFPRIYKTTCLNMCFLFFMVNSLYLILFFLHSFPFFCNLFRRHGHVANLFNIVRRKKNLLTFHEFTDFRILCGLKLDHK